MEQQLQNEDVSHLKALKICHYVMGGLGLLGFLGMIGYSLLIVSVLNNPEIMGPDEMTEEMLTGLPENFIPAMGGIYLVGALFALIPAILNFMTASALGKRKSKGLIYTTSALNCLNIPIGTVLGVFTFIVLSRDSVKTLFNQSKIN